MLQAAARTDPFEYNTPVPRSVMDNIAWIKNRSDNDIMAERESIVAGIESKGDSAWADGLCEEWLRGAVLVFLSHAFSLRILS